MGAIASWKAVPDMISQSNPRSSVLSSRLRPSPSPWSLSRSVMSFLSWSKRPGGSRLKTIPAPPARLVAAPGPGPAGAGARVRPKRLSRNPIPVAGSLPGQVGFHLLELGDPVLQRWVGREDLGDRAAADRREEHQRVADLDLAQVLVGDPLHPAADLDQG